VAALGTAAAGLVDTTKTLWGGISHCGFWRVTGLLDEHFKAALDVAAGESEWRRILRGAWVNGMAMDDQIAKAKALVMQGLTEDTAAKLKLPDRIDREKLGAIATAMDAGAHLEPDQQVAFNRFDACVEAMLRGAYERADQIYRNVAKAAAAVIAVGLAIEGGAILHASKAAQAATDAATKHQQFVDAGYGAHEIMIAFIVGAVAVPLAPIAKDLASSLQAAVKAMQSAGG
jgi:hypothetical protein